MKNFLPQRYLVVYSLFSDLHYYISNSYVSLDHTDPGTRANPAKPNLLAPGVETTDLSPYIGTEVKGVQISHLNKAGLDELALYAAQRKVLILRNQDFKDQGPDRQIEIAR